MKGKIFKKLVNLTYPKPKYSKRWKVEETSTIFSTKFVIDKSFRYKTLLFNYNVRFVQYDESKEKLTIHISRISIFYSLICKILTPEQEMKWASRLMVLNIGFNFQHESMLDDVYEEYNIPSYMLCDRKMKIHNRKNKIQKVLK